MNVIKKRIIDLNKEINSLYEEQEGEYEEVGDNGGISGTKRYWDIDKKLDKLHDELDKLESL